MRTLAENHQLTHLIVTYGYWAILIGATADSFGVPIPGEAMVLTASIYAGATHRLILPLVIVAAVAGAIFGDNLSFTLGRQGGARIVARYGPILRFDGRRQYLAQYLFRHYGGKVVIAGRFLPIVHIWTAFLAGTHAMPWRQFALCNAAGCVAWFGLLGSVGYVFGSAALGAGGMVAAIAPMAGTVILLLALMVLRLMEGRLQRAADRSCAYPHYTTRDTVCGFDSPGNRGADY